MSFIETSSMKVLIPRTSDDGSGKETSSSSLLWTLLAFVMFSVTLLFATDVFEFEQNVQDSSSVKNTSFSNGVIVQEKRSPEAHQQAISVPTYEIQMETTHEPKQISTEVPQTSYDKDEKPKDEVSRPDSPATSGTVVTTQMFGAGTSSRHTYSKRGQPMADQDRKAMIEEWGSWTLVDDKKDQRPKDDFYAAYPNRDVPRSEFPKNAWQIDKKYLAKFIPESMRMVNRAYNAILAEYGLDDNDIKFFHVEKFDELPDLKGHKCLALGGCTTNKSWENLKRRLLHAVMTEDMFVLAMGGHSSAAGHGNHFTQSYTLQVQWILEAVFARLGVRHQSRNFGMGGLGTFQAGLATKSLYGHDVDMLLWDSGMTEKEARFRDVLFRQGILGLGKVPLIMSMMRYDVVSTLGKAVDADFIAVGEMNDPVYGIPEGRSQEQIDNMTWAIQYVRCSSEMSSICRANEYAGECWIERDDVSPPKKQKDKMGGRAKWHPGNRKHQSHGRNLSMMILAALKEVFAAWNHAKDFEMKDEEWHVTSLYNNIRSKTEAYEGGECTEFQSEIGLSNIMCNNAINARTEFTPRVRPDYSSIRSLMPSAQLKEINDPPPSLYNAPDVFNKNLHPPAGAIDVLNIVEAGVDYSSNLVPDYEQYLVKPKFERAPSVPIGKGHYLNSHPGFCDGSVDSWCRRGDTDDCLLYGHNDGRTGILTNSMSGWMVLYLPNVKAGFIALKFETWHMPAENKKTVEWTTINNQRRLQDGHNSAFLRSVSPRKPQNVTVGSPNKEKERRELGKTPPPDYCNEFRFEFSIDGKNTSWDRGEFGKQNKIVERVVEVVKLVEDPSLTGGKDKEIELAFRITGCGSSGKTFMLSHVYWA